MLAKPMTYGWTGREHSLQNKIMDKISLVIFILLPCGHDTILDTLCHEIRCMLKTNFPCFVFLWNVTTRRFKMTCVPRISYVRACTHLQSPAGVQGLSSVCHGPSLFRGRGVWGRVASLRPSGSPLTAVSVPSRSYLHKGGTRKSQTPLVVPPQQPHQALRGSNMGERARVFKRLIIRSQGIY